MKIKWEKHRETIDPLNEHGQAKTVVKYKLRGSRFIDEIGGSLNTIVVKNGKYCVGEGDSINHHCFNTLEKAKTHQLKIFYTVLHGIKNKLETAISDVECILNGGGKI